jgi:hypothetical protein
MKEGGRECSLPSSTVGCRPFIRRTSGSSADKAGGTGGSSCTGFDRFGSSPLRRAFAILKAWNLAYLILEAISGLSGVCHVPNRSRKVAAAWKVWAVCLVYVRMNYHMLHDTHAVALFVLIAVSALLNVSSANCSTYACAATSS